MTCRVLIVGAGPTGLNLALSLARRNVPFRLLSDAPGPGEHSRAMVVQARTLEFYDQLGFAKEVIEGGVIADAAHIRQGDDRGKTRDVATIRFAELGRGVSPYPFALAYPQDDHERFLIGELKEAGCAVEWQSKLMGFREEGNAVRATVLRDGQTEEICADYICGCDGAHSKVREAMGVGFPGGTYEQLFYVADVRIQRDFSRDLYINLGRHLLTLLFPVRSNGMQRLIGLVPPELSQREDLRFDHIRNQVERLLEEKVIEVNWFSTYRVHHRVAARFRSGRAFLLGDAGHIHSPVGGQGMNTGIGDAVNLGWKLAHVLQGRADPVLLDSYEPERIGFARALVATTDRAFTPLTSAGVSGTLTRKIVAPLLFAGALRFAPTRRAVFRVISQARIRYPESPLSQGVAGRVHGGDRLPWLGEGSPVNFGRPDNFAPLRSLDWQLHVHGNISQDLASAARELGLATQVFASDKRAAHAGFRQGSAYLVRPDGYISIVLPTQDVASLHGFVQRFGLRF
ncbi:MAG: monooxygenase, FAD-binding [Acidobacteriaceae bacterium]|nr:monooxygenase, FAD-binding [Acidobacteriaceae bacterium]